MSAAALVVTDPGRAEAAVQVTVAAALDRLDVRIGRLEALADREDRAWEQLGEMVATRRCGAAGAQPSA